MALDDTARLLGEATRRTNIAIANYRRNEAAAEADFRAHNGPNVERQLQQSGAISLLTGAVSLTVRSAVAGGYTALCQTWGRQVGAAARLVESSRATMVQAARALEAEARSIAGRAVITVSQKTAQHVANELLAAVAADATAASLLETYRGTRWAANDPAETPFVAMGLRLPSTGEGESWARGIYNALVGEDYAALHPWQAPTLDVGGGFVLPWWVPVGGGLAFALWLIFKDAFRR